MCWKMKMPEMPKVETSARDLVPQTESKAPDSPQFGDTSFLDSARKRGTQALKIDKTGTDTTGKWYGY